MSLLAGISTKRRHYSTAGDGSVTAPKGSELINRENAGRTCPGWAALVNIAEEPTVAVLQAACGGRFVELGDVLVRISKEKISDCQSPSLTVM